MNFLFRHRIAVIAVVVDILAFAMIYIFPLYIVPVDDVFINNDNSLYFFLINVWGWLHVPTALLPISWLFAVSSG
jgi:hypothetical protein